MQICSVLNVEQTDPAVSRPHRSHVIAAPTARGR
jgi:hypothetical protein